MPKQFTSQQNAYNKPQQSFPNSQQQSHPNSQQHAWNKKSQPVNSQPPKQNQNLNSQQNANRRSLDDILQNRYVGQQANRNASNLYPNNLNSNGWQPRNIEEDEDDVSFDPKQDNVQCKQQ